MKPKSYFIAHKSDIWFWRIHSRPRCEVSDFPLIIAAIGLIICMFAMPTHIIKGDLASGLMVDFGFLLWLPLILTIFTPYRLMVQK